MQIVITNQQTTLESGKVENQFFHKHEGVYARLRFVEPSAWVLPRAPRRLGRMDLPMHHAFSNIDLTAGFHFTHRRASCRKLPSERNAIPANIERNFQGTPTRSTLVLARPDGPASSGTGKPEEAREELDNALSPRQTILNQIRRTIQNHQ